MASLKSVAAVAAVAFASRAVADNHIQKITAMANPFSFEPNTITAAIGDILEFHFMPANHSVAMGSFDSPCSPMEGGFWSGYAPTESGEFPQVFQVEVTTEDPMVFYCTQGQHCSQGMYGVVNPSNEQSLESYQSVAAQAQTVAPSGGQTGGKWVDPGTEMDHSDDSDSTSNEDGGSGAFSVKASLAGIAAAVGVALVMA